MITTKKCDSCKVVKNIFSFSRSFAQKDTYAPYCKPCATAKSKASRASRISMTFSKYEFEELETFIKIFAPEYNTRGLRSLLYLFKRTRQRKINQKKLGEVHA
jgi:hypothetical protein